MLAKKVAWVVDFHVLIEAVTCDGPEAGLTTAALKDHPSHYATVLGCVTWHGAVAGKDESARKGCVSAGCKIERFSRKFIFVTT